LKPVSEIDPGDVKKSPPTRGRGLKQFRLDDHLGREEVAPHAGAWVETRAKNPAREASPVAPHAGAWVETFSNR